MSVKQWICQDCGHEVYSPSGEQYHNNGKPAPIRWTDGHTCRFVLGPEEKEDGR